MACCPPALLPAPYPQDKSKDKKWISKTDMAAVETQVSVKLARKRAREEQCVRKTQMADGSIKVEHYPLLKIDGLADCIMRRKYDATHAIGYGLPVAVVMFLRLQLLAAVMLLLMFCVSVPESLRSIHRSHVRQECRAALTADNYAALTDSNATFHASWPYESTSLVDVVAMRKQCGYHAGDIPGLRVGDYPQDDHFPAASAVMPQQSMCNNESALNKTGLACGKMGGMPDDTGWFGPFLSLGLGSCMEYGNNANSSLPTYDLEQLLTLLPEYITEAGRDKIYFNSFVSIPASEACVTGEHDWYSYLTLINVGICGFFLFILRRMARSVAIAHTKNHWTASDYSVMLSGLERGPHVPADDRPDGSMGLERKLLFDLAALGFKDDIDHIEIGRSCRTEMQKRRTLDRLMVLESQINLRRQKDKAEIKAGTGKERPQKERDVDLAAHGQVWKDIGATQQDLERLRQEGQWATGHAFICFKMEERRNDFMEVMRRDDLINRFLAWVMGRKGKKAPHLECAAPPQCRERFCGCFYGGGVTCFDAPEPEDIYWENLEFDGSAFQTEQRLFTSGVSAFVIFIAVLISIAVRVLQSSYKPDGSLIVNLIISLGSAVIISLANLILQMLLPKLAKREAYGTYIAYELAVFGKLSWAYLLNTTLLPLAFALAPVGLTQAWYEEGGVIQQAFYMMVASGSGFPIVQLTQPFYFLQRHVFAKMVTQSQAKLDKMWKPPRFMFAQHYASTLKALSLGLVYAPLWPPAYLVTAVLLFFAFGCYKGALRYWSGAGRKRTRASPGPFGTPSDSVRSSTTRYGRPRPLNELLCNRLVDFLLLLLLVHVVVNWNAQRKVSARANEDGGADSSWDVISMKIPLLMLSLLLWFASLVIFRIHRLLTGNFRAGEAGLSLIGDIRGRSQPPCCLTQAGTAVEAGAGTPGSPRSHRRAPSTSAAAAQF